MKELFNFVDVDPTAGMVILFVCCLFTIVASLFDMWTAIEAVRANGQKPSSHPMRRTGIKIIDYLRLIFFVTMIDVLGLLAFSWYGIPYCVLLITVGILLREGVSMRENYELKKSNAMEALDMAAEIVKCVSKEDAEKLLQAINAKHIINKKRFR